MAEKHFQELGMDSFFGRFIYDRVVPRDHFLVQLNQVMDWDSFTELLLPTYPGLAEEGRPPYPPVVLLKMLVVAYLYHLSERQVEEMTTYHLAIKEFVGLAVDEPAPDHSTLSVCKRRLLAAGGWERLQAICDEVLRQARAAGIRLGQVQVVDSVHTEADRRRQEEGKPPRDPQAQWVKKGERRSPGPEGEVTRQEIRYLGYKSHTSLNAETGLITTIVPTVGRAADNEVFPRLLAHDEEIGVGATIYAGDKAYDDTDLHYRLWAGGKGSALRLKEDRTRVSNDHQAFWRQVAASAAYQAGQAERFKVERKYGEAKRWHGFGRCRYLGLLRYGIQAYLTALVLNLKRIVVLLRGVRFRAGSRRWQAVVA